MVSGYPTSTIIPRVDGLSIGPPGLGRHNLGWVGQVNELPRPDFGIDQLDVICVGSGRSVNYAAWTLELTS